MSAVRVAQHAFVVATRGRGFIAIDDELTRVVADSAIVTGTAHVFCQHTSCSLVISENADRDVRGDLERFFSRLVPDGDALFRHDAEGPDDMPAHIRAVLTGVSLTIPVSETRLALGTWQGVYLWEHRQAPHQRRIVVTVTGEGRE
jgi:secondary thiamine-phosphate synthase enzyme